MRTSISILLYTLLLVVGCKENKNENKNPVESISEKSSAVSDLKNNVLCLINGEPWSYTESSGIVVTDKKKDIRKLMLTFTKYLNPGKEHIGLDYDMDTNELIEASVQIKQPGTDGKRIHAIYQFNERVKKNSNSTISGSVTLNEGEASGSAMMQHIPIQYEAHSLSNKEYAEITVTRLSFNSIPFSDVKREMEAIFKNSK